MIHNWNSSNHASLSSIVFTKLNVKSHFVPLSGTCTCRQGNCYNRSPMWPSLGFKPFSTKKLHDFIYTMSLDNHLNNSLSFSNCVASHHHWHKSTVYYSFTKHCVILCKMFSKMLNEMGGWAGDNFVHWMSQVPTRKRYQSVNVLTGIAIPQPDSSPTAHQSICWSCNVDKAPTRHGHALGNENIEKNGDGHMWKWCKIINVNNKFIK